MNIWAILPVRPIDDGKSRLAGVMSAAERAALNQKFFQHALKITAAVVGVERTLVVSRSLGILEIAAAVGVHALEEQPGGDLNTALTAAAHIAGEQGAEGVLSVSCDLPLLAEADLQAMLACEAGVAIAPDRAGAGTNALLLSPVGLISYAYGEGSFQKHVEALWAGGAKVVVVQREGLAFDIDTEPDLARLRQLRPDF